MPPPILAGIATAIAAGLFFAIFYVLPAMRIAREELSKDRGEED